MSSDQIWGGSIRKLWPTETHKFRDHLLRLDMASRRMRFAHAVSNGFIADYAAHMAENGAIVYGYFDGDDLCASAELRKLGPTWGREAEAAFAVEQGYREKGIGTELLGRLIRSARNRGVSHLVMSCLAENARMQAVARHHHADLRFEAGEVLAEILPENASPLSLLGEAVEDRLGYLLNAFDVRSRVSPAA